MKKYLVIGNPIEHSLSPKLHNYRFEKNNIDANYDRRKIDKGEIQEIINEIKDNKLDGINVTVPFKTDIIPCQNTPVPPIITTNKEGPMSTTVGSTGMDTEVLSGGHYVTVAGVSKHTVNKDSNGAGGDINISAKRNMTTDVTQTYRVTAKTIFLN